MENFILHEACLGALFRDPKKAGYKILGSFKGSEMKGWRYVPLFNYYTEKVTLVCLYRPHELNFLSLKIELSVLSVIHM